MVRPAGKPTSSKNSDISSVLKDLTSAMNSQTSTMSSVLAELQGDRDYDLSPPLHVEPGTSGYDMPAREPVYPPIRTPERPSMFSTPRKAHVHLIPLLS